MTTKAPPIATVEALRAIAHPARIRLYELLTLGGPATVSQLAAKAELAIGSVSYHLQQLHRAGFIAEAPATSQDRRTHWWQAVPGGLRWSPADFLGSPSGREVSSTAQRMLTERRVQRLGQWNASWHRWDKAWVDAAVETDAVLRLTPRELAGLSAEIGDLIQRWAHRDDDADPPDEPGERHAVFMFLSAFPVEDGVSP